MLLLGVHSWQNVDALRRRRVIRKLNREELNHDGLVVMRFIMPERKPLVASARGKMLPMVQRRERTSLESEDGERADLLRFTLAAKYHTKSAHKYLLANAFLRHAAALPYKFVGRSEDDALVDLHELGLNLHRVLLQHTARSSGSSGDSSSRVALIPGIGGSGGVLGGGSGGSGGSSSSGSSSSSSGGMDGGGSSDRGPMLLFGISGLWVMWDQANMLPMCWNARWVDHGGVCDFRFLGPFLLFQGPLVIYSRALAHALISLPRFTTDEARVSGNWSAILKGRRATPEIAQHLGIVHSGIAEDVYYSALLASPPLGAALNLTIFDVPLAEYKWHKARPRHLMRPSAVFHRLLTWQHLNASGLVRSLVNMTHWRTGAAAGKFGAELPTERALKGDVEPTGLLSEWWRRVDAKRGAHVSGALAHGMPPQHSARGMAPPACSSYTQRYKAFRWRSDKQREISQRYCCANWRICTL